MSIEYLNACFASSLRGNCRHVLLALANHADRDGLCWPSINTIAAHGGVSRRTAQSCLDTLEADGYLIREHRFRENGSQTSSIYLLDLVVISNAAIAEIAHIKQRKCRKISQTLGSANCTGGVQETVKDRPKPQKGCHPRTTTSEAPNNNNEHGRGSYQIPESIPEDEVNAVVSILNNSKLTDYQLKQICDVLNYASSGSKIIQSYPAYTAGLVKKAINGVLTPAPDKQALGDSSTMTASHVPFKKTEARPTDEQIRAARAARDESMIRLTSAIGL